MPNPEQMTTIEGTLKFEKKIGETKDQDERSCSRCDRKAGLVASKEEVAGCEGKRKEFRLTRNGQASARDSWRLIGT